jgi:hypothetical protein
MGCRKLGAALAVLASAAVVAGCGSGGSSSGVSASEYVRSICTAVGPFEKDVAARSNALNAGKFTTAAEGKKAVKDFLTAVSADTDKALSRLRAAGTPSVDNGKVISTTIVGAFEELRGAIGSALTQAKSLSTTSPRAFKDGANQLGGTVRSSLGGISASLGKLKSTELEKAAAKEPACTALSAA